jgi:serine/threonine protein kinase
MEDMKSERRAINKLCLHNRHINIVFVLRHGWLGDSGNYFFDMELCDYNLETYIKLKLWKPTHFEKRLLDSNGDPPIDVVPRMKYIWIIMKDIASGVHYIHQEKEIHRDLKPKNGI